MTKRRLFTLTAAAVAGLVLALIAGMVLTAPDTAVLWSSFSSAGGTSSSANFGVAGVAGQSSPIGESSSENFGVASGYSPGAAPVPIGTPTGTTPDLVGAIIGPGSACHGQAIHGEVTISLSNLGASAAGEFAEGVYISADATITTSDLLVAREFILSLSGTSIVSAPLVSGNVPLSTPLGAMYLGLLVDEFDAVAESDETNNDSAVPIEITPNFDGDTLCDDVDPDDDNDGCTDVKELEPKSLVAAGGGRNPHDFWDFFDTWATGSRTGNIDGFDIGDVVSRFGTISVPPLTKEEAFAAALTAPTATGNYHAGSDRDSPDPEANVWNLGPANDRIDGFDIAFVVVQFGHTCL